MSASTAVLDRTVEQGMAFLDDLLGWSHPRAFAVRLWDGSTWHAGTGGEPAQFTLVLKHPGALRAVFWPTTELNMAEGYVHGDFDIEGDVAAVFPVADALLTRPWSMATRLRLARRLLSLPAGGRRGNGHRSARLHGERHTKARDRQAIAHHYDVSNDFYSLWLDERMVYSSAYFATSDDSLDSAQERKLDYICRKLRLQPGERLLDIGCGWGGLIVHAAQRYGVEAHGVTLSRNQADLARERIDRAGLAGRCRVEFGDYRDLDASRPFDKLASIGMFEHVGEAQLPTYFDQAWRLLRPGGVFLNHGIAASATAPATRGPSLVDRYVFPDGELVPISTMLRAAERSGFEVRDVESLREHYALTLRHWVRRLESRYDDARRFVDETTYRIWRLYMAGSADGFHTGRLNVFQTLLVKPDRGRSGLPLTRADWYG